MNEAEKIILCILAGTLVVFLVLGIFIFIKIIRLIDSLEDLTSSIKSVATSTSGVINAAADIITAGNIVRTISDIINSLRGLRKSKTNKERKLENLDD